MQNTLYKICKTLETQEINKAYKQTTNFMDVKLQYVNLKVGEEIYETKNKRKSNKFTR